MATTTKSERAKAMWANQEIRQRILAGRWVSTCVRYNHHHRRLTPEQVRAARARWGDGESQSSIAREFGVTQAVIWNVVHLKTYKDVS